MKLFAGTAACAAAAAIVMVSILGGPGGGGPAVTQPPGKAGGAATVRLGDGTRLIPRQGAKYAVTGKRALRLDAGQVLLLVAKADKPFVVTTPRGSASARGTAFTVAAEPDGTFVAVGQGRVELSNAAGSVEVRAGQQAFAPGGARPRRSAAPRFSHTVSWAREQLAGEKLFQAEEKHATGELVAVDPWGQQVRLDLRKYCIDVVIEDGIARTTVDQTFFNNRTWQMEGTFYFPLPPDASLSRLAMYVSDNKESAELNEGGMVERDYGRFVYESIVYTRRDPALLEMMEGNVFKMRVFPLLPRREKRIILSYTQTLGELYRTLRYWFPMEHTADKAGLLSIRVRVVGGAGRLEALSSTHAVATRADKGDLLVEYEAKDVAPNQDFLLGLRPLKDDDAPAAVRSFDQDGLHYVFARWRPKLTGAVEPRPRQWFVLNDVSASRSAVDVKAQAFILQRLLAEADDWDGFAVVNLDTRARAWRKQPASVCDPAAAEAAVRFANVGERMGATNLSAGLSAVAELVRATRADNAHIVYLGDGVATDGMTRPADLLTLLPGGSTFIGIGVGKKVDARLLQAAADATGGVYATINPDEDISWRVFDLVGALNTPRLVQVTAAFTDASGKPAAVDAYPSTGTLCDGEALTVLARCGKDDTPRKMLLSGTMGGKRFVEEVDLAAARPGAAYAPRLWASARINHLLKENAELHKPEIVDLSKHYYVVTPFTSLIVLETKADYERWKVEMGRKDHWRLYDAPKKIADRYEQPTEAEQQGWGWWWRNIPAAAMKGKPGHPATVEDIVESVQFRVHVPIYGHYPHQRQRMERYKLQALLSGRLVLAGYGVTAPLPGWGGEEKKGDKPGAAVPTAEDPMSITTELLDRVGGRRGTDGRFGFAFEDDVHGLGVGFYKSLNGDWGLPFGHGGANGKGPFFGNAVSGRLYSYLAPDVFAPDELMSADKPMAAPRLAMPALRKQMSGILPMSGVLGDMEIAMPLLLEKQEQGKGQVSGFEGWLATASEKKAKRSSPMGPAMGPALGEMAGGYFMLSSYTLDDVSFRQLGRASMERAMADRERIRQYNRRYGGWWYGDWDESGDMRRSVGTLTVSGVLQPLAVLAGADVSKAAEAIAAPAASSTPMPAQPIFGGKERRESRIAMPSLLLQSYSEATGAVPGTLAALAADRFIPLRAKLAEMKPSERRDAAIAAIDAALKKLPEAAAACESTGAFWSYQGWQTMPAIWDFQQPACQAWPGSMSMRDVTQWAPGLQSTWSDVAAAVLDAFGRKPAGKVDDRAAEAIAAARRNTPLMRIKHVDANDNVLAELWAAGGDRFAWTGRGDMYLREDFICDGKAIYQVYPELGLAARRGQLAWRLPALRGLVPHVMPPADQLARACDVAFVEQRDGRTTVKLTAVSEPEETAPRGKPTSRPSGESAIRNPQSAISLLVTFDGWGFIHNEEWRVGGKPRLMRTFAHDGAKVVSTWTGRTEKGEDKRLGEGRYLCEVREPAGVVTQFNAPGAETVVIDMPLRRCEHYEALLKEAGSGDANRPERIRLGRQLAMAALQEHGWQQPWGSVRKTYETLLNVHKELKAADRPVLVGDVTLMGCSGYSPGTISGAQPRMPSEPALQTYMQNHGNANRMAELAKEQNGTFIGHLAAYAMTYQGGDRLAAVKKFLADYPDSPLHYAAAMYAGNDEKTWLELAKLPRWRLVALYTAAQRQPSAAVAEAFEAYHKEMLEHGWSVPISRQVAAALKTDKARWRRVLDRCHKAAADANDAGALLRLAELAWVCRLDGDDQQLADRCLTEAEKLAGTRLPLAWKLAVTQSLWAMGRTKEAWDKQQEVLAALAEHKLAASPALLALSARLAQAAGQHARAVELEMAAIEAEKPHMPQRINVHLFRQRYQWLWNELTQRVRQCAEAVKKTPADAAAGRLLTEALDRAKGVWDTWMRVDSANANSLYQQLAALYRDAGRTDDAWRVVSSIIDEKPKDGQSYYFVGTYFRGGNDSDAALGFYARACEVEPTNGDWAWGRADFLKQLGRKKEARAAFEEIARTKWQPRFEHYVNRAKEAMKGLQATAPGGAITPR